MCCFTVIVGSLLIDNMYLSKAVNGEGDGGAEKSFILNKVAQLFTSACLVDYPCRWSLFFDTLVESVSLGPAAVDLYLRILLAIDGEVVDRDIAHTDQVRCRTILTSIRPSRSTVHTPFSVYTSRDIGSILFWHSSVISYATITLRLIHHFSDSFLQVNFSFIRIHIFV